MHRIDISDSVIFSQIIQCVDDLVVEVTPYSDVPTTIIPLYVNYIEPVSGDVKVDLSSGLMAFFNGGAA